MRDYNKLEVLKKAHLMVLYVYKNVLPLFPAHEKYDLQNQIKRATYSIPLNTVEGSGRKTEKDFTHFLDNALGSVHELEYSCLLAKDLGYLVELKFDEINRQINEVKAMLIGLIKYLRHIK